MDIKASFKYVFSDEAWFMKLIVPALWGLIPVVGVLVLGGWGLKVARRVIDGKDENKLPRVEFGADLQRGFYASLIDLIYILPAAITLAVSITLITFANNAAGVSQVALLVMGGLFGLMGVLLMVLWLFAASVACANFIAKGRFSAAFNLKALVGLLRHAFPSWLLLIVIQLFVMMVIAPMGGIVCGIGLLFTTAYAAVVYAHLLGQAYQQSVTPVHDGILAQ